MIDRWFSLLLIGLIGSIVCWIMSFDLKIAIAACLAWAGLIFIYTAIEGLTRAQTVGAEKLEHICTRNWVKAQMEEQRLALLPYYGALHQKLVNVESNVNALSYRLSALLEEEYPAKAKALAAHELEQATAAIHPDDAELGRLL